METPKKLKEKMKNKFFVPHSTMEIIIYSKAKDVMFFMFIASQIILKFEVF